MAEAAKEKSQQPITGLWGKKIGMTQLFVDDKSVPATAIDIGNWIVTNIKTKERDGYSAIQVGCVKKRHVSNTFETGWLKKPKYYFSHRKEVRLEHDPEGIIIGKPAGFHMVVVEGDAVDIFGRTKGAGFAGVVRRHNFAGAPGSHGSTMGKKTGSIGSMAACGKVIKGKKMPGQMGNRQRVMENLKVIKIEQEANVLLVKGSVPGKAGTLVFIRKKKKIKAKKYR